jgi:hypothetical protein
MRSRLAALLLVVVVCSGVALAQHATEPFVFGSSAPRDSWTGTVKSLDHDKGIVTMEYEHKGKTESFVGTIKPPLDIFDKDGNHAKPPIHIQQGDRLTVHYFKEGAKYSSQEGGKRHEEVASANLITQIKFLAPAKE